MITGHSIAFEDRDFKLKMDKDLDLYTFYDSMEKSNILLSFKGEITSDLLTSILQIMESKLDNFEEKSKTKKKVKDIAKELIKLYADRKSKTGFGFSPDTYLQNELEASFIFEDTPDQLKATQSTKQDMESSVPMDRLICGDVGFGKTDIAIRAAFKAVADNKQVAILVPTTILAMQHYQTFRSRLREFPCNVDYINRFKSDKQQKKSIADLKSGKTDIIIGTHRLLSKVHVLTLSTSFRNSYSFIFFPSDRVITRTIRFY